MFEHDLRINAYLTDYVLQLVNNVPEERFADQPHGVANHPAWTLGHLAIGYDHAANCLGHKRELESLDAKFAPGSMPTAVRADYPSKAELLATFKTAGDRVRAAIPSADPASMTGPQPIEFLKPHIRSVHDLFLHLLTTHVAIHIGQLSGWQRAAGLRKS